MGILSTLLASSKTINGTRSPLSTAATRELRGMLQSVGDIDIPTAFAAVNEVQSIAIHEDGVDGGTFTLTVTLASGETFTTAAIAFDANAATIETAIDTAATTATITGWTNGDITVAGGPLTTTPLTLTFDGDSVEGLNHGMTAITSSLTDGGVPEDAGAVTQTTAGHTARAAWALLSVLGIIGGTVPDQGDDASAVTANISAGAMPHSLSQDTIKQLFVEISVQDDNADLVTTLNALFGW